MLHFIEVLSTPLGKLCGHLNQQLHSYANVYIPWGRCFYKSIMKVNLGLCMCIHVCTGTRVYTGALAHGCGEQRTTSSVVPRAFVWENEGLWLSWSSLSRAGRGTMNPKRPPDSVSPHWIIACSTTSRFHWSQVLVLTKQVLYQLSHLRSPESR